MKEVRHIKKKQLHNYKQESIPVECIPPTCADHMCFFNSHQMSAVVREGFSGEQVWTCLQSWPSDVTRREGPGGDPLCIEIPCPGPRLGPCTVRSTYIWGRGWAQAGPVQWGPMHHGQWLHRTFSPTVKRQTRLKTSPSHNFVGRR